ncbi:MAG: Fe-S cluster assembly ATPase SufC [Thermotogaceae bacterium]|nr:Fe-S cluster assembly ATPase SufC [Thermotogaceae bacterium]
MLEVKNLAVKLEDGEEILKGVNIDVGDKEIVVIMGPNGSGKSTLVNAIMGNEKYKVIDGDILFEGKSIKDLPTHERAKRGIYVSFQNPPEIEGIRLSSFIPMVLQRFHPEDNTSIPKLRKLMKESFEIVGLNESFLSRYINVGFSGGEKKRAEMAQLYIVKPKLAILDEIDSGLDVDALKVISKIINDLKESGTSFLLITHNPRLLHHIEDSRVYVMVNGMILKEGDKSLAFEVEEKGYEAVIR